MLGECTEKRIWRFTPVCDLTPERGRFDGGVRPHGYLMTDSRHYFSLRDRIADRSISQVEILAYWTLLGISFTRVALRTVPWRHVPRSSRWF